MESGIIDQPPTEKNTNGNRIDRISELPDCILHHILSFLETKCTVQTSILSKRWRHIWASVPALDLTDNSFIRNASWWSNDSYKCNFENFVDTVLLLRDASDLHSFSLRCYNYFDAGHVDRWIRYATKYNPKVLRIKLAQWDCFPLEILPCQFLEELSMNHFIVQHGPPKIMGCLRRLHIQSVNYKHGFMENLISSCPVLEDLDLYNCVFDALCISSNTLKRLRIKSCIGLSENLISSCPVLEDLDLYICVFDALCISSNTLKRLCIDSCVFRLSENLISAPSLICLTYIYNSAGTTLKNLSSLLNATVHIIRGDAFEITRGLANVETLTFSFSEVYQCKLPGLFPIFDNLRSLRFAGKCTSYLIQVIAFFLQRSPNLKTFDLKNMGISPLSLWRWKVIQKSSKLSFKCPHLQLIQIHCSMKERKLRELFKYLRELIKYLRVNATGEPRVVIIWDWRYF